MKGVLCSGAIVYDTLVRPVDEERWGTTTLVESIEFHVGGNGASTSMALGILGTPVRLMGAVGQDAPGCFLLEKLHGAGVDVSSVAKEDAPTAATVGIVNSRGDRRFLHRPGVSKSLFDEPPEFAGPLIEGMSHYHFASLFILPRLREHGAAMLRAARAAGLSTSFDTNWDPLGRWMADVEPCLQDLDLLFMNEDEMRMLTGSADPAIAARVVIGKGVRTAVMKLGGRGCAIFTGEREAWVPAFPVEVRDTTGAGDCFVAGFLTAWLDGASLEEAGRFANAVGAGSVSAMGAVTGVRGREETRRWMESFV